MRTGELLGLLNSDIDLQHKYLEVRQSVEEVRKRYYWILKAAGSFLSLPQPLRLFFLVDLPAQLAVDIPALIDRPHFILNDLAGLLQKL